jgi:2-isopropylmalate synthase
MILIDAVGTLASPVRTCTKVSISDGTGPVDASFKAISKIIQDCEAYVLKEYTVSSVTAGVDALGEVTVRLGTTETGRNVFGRSANTDVIVASAQAYVAAINRLICLTGSQIPTHPQFNSL